MKPQRIQRKRSAGWQMPANTVYVGRPGKWGNPFDFRKSEYCWAALSFGCRGDRAGRQEASVRAYKDWIEPPHGRRTLKFEEQPSIGDDQKTAPLGPPIVAGEAPSIADIQAALRGRNLACWCALCERHKNGKPFDQDCAECEPCHVDPLGRIANR